GTRKFLRRNAAQPADFAGNHFGSALPLRIGPASCEALRALDEFCAAWGSWIFHRLQCAGRAAVVESRQENFTAHDHGASSDLAGLRPVRRVDRQQTWPTT